MIVPIVLVLGGLAGLYYWRRGSRPQHVVGADAQEVTVQPYRAIVNLHATGSQEFGTLFQPSPPSATTVDRVVVTGGRRWVPVWDKSSVTYDNPARVDVYVKGQAAPRSFAGNVDQVTVFGGARAAPGLMMARR